MTSGEQLAAGSGVVTGRLLCQATTRGARAAPGAGVGCQVGGPGGSLDVGLLQRGDRTAEGAARGAQFGENVDRPRDRFGAQHE